MAVSPPIGMEGSHAAAMRSSYAFVIGGGDSVVEIHHRESGLSYCLVRSSNRTDLSLVSVRGESVCWLHRKQRFPRPQFDVGISQEPFGSISCIDLVRSRYKMTLGEHGAWILQMPLFRVDFFAASPTAGTAKIRVRRENQWELLFDSDSVSPVVLGALATIFRARWTST